MIHNQKHTRHQILGFIILSLVALLFLIVFHSDLSTAALSSINSLAKKTIKLTFKQSGQVNKVYVKINDKVNAGQVLIDLNKDNVFAQLHATQASLQIEEAKLEDLKNTRQTNTATSALALAKVALENTKKDTIYVIQSTYTKADDAIRDKAGQVFLNQNALTPLLLFDVFDGKLRSDISYQMSTLQNLLNSWHDSLNALDVSSDLNATMGEAQKNLALIVKFLNNLALATNSIPPDSTSVNPTTLRNWKSDIFSARTNIDTAIKDLSAASGKLKYNQTALDAEEQKSSLASSSTKDHMDFEDGKVKQIQSQIETIQVNINDMTLKSPVKGVIKNIYIRPGAVVSAHSAAIFLEEDSHTK